MEIAAPYLLFLGDVEDQLGAKTAQGVAHWRPEKCLGQLRLPGCKADLGLPDMSVAEAATKGCRTLVVGVVNAGGFLPESWSDVLFAAVAAGMDIASGLHVALDSVPGLGKAAADAGCTLHDVRLPPRGLRVGKGRRDPGRRLLSVGTDCSVGKMYTTLALHREMTTRGMKASFRATGQTGILIAGEGISVDAVVADFISGAIEQMTPAADADHWDVIEGQGSLFHPSFAGVSLGLLHGSRADALVMCHAPGRLHMRGARDYALPALAECVALNEQLARLTNPAARVIGFAFNTAHLDEAEARNLCDRTGAEFGLPATDPVRFGVAALVDALPG